MDIAPLLQQLQEQFQNADTLTSLQLQNHLYGCFLVMEDIAQETVKYDPETERFGEAPHDFSLYAEFSLLGMRYGFLSDTQLRLTRVSNEYRQAWLNVFHYAKETHSVEWTDQVEDQIIEWIRTVVPEKQSFFGEAIQHGSLSTPWITTALHLLIPSVMRDTEQEEEEWKLEKEKKKTLLEEAHTENSLTHGSRYRRFAATRRRVHFRDEPPSVTPPSLAITMKAHRH